MKKIKFLTQTILYKTELFDKEYFWMQDTDGSKYLIGVDKDGLPDFS